MSQVEDGLVDYEDEVNIPLQQSKLGSTDASTQTSKEKNVKKGSYVGIHSTSFRDFLLKPELLRAISDCGFEHPSEGNH